METPQNDDFQDEDLKESQVDNSWNSYKNITIIICIFLILMVFLFFFYYFYYFSEPNENNIGNKSNRKRDNVKNKMERTIEEKRKNFKEKYESGKENKYGISVLSRFYKGYIRSEYINLIIKESNYYLYIHDNYDKIDNVTILTYVNGKKSPLIQVLSGNLLKIKSFFNELNYDETSSLTLYKVLINDKKTSCIIRKDDKEIIRTFKDEDNFEETNSDLIILKEILEFIKDN